MPFLTQRRNNWGFQGPPHLFVLWLFTSSPPSRIGLFPTGRLCSFLLLSLTLVFYKTFSRILPPFLVRDPPGVIFFLRKKQPPQVCANHKPPLGLLSFFFPKTSPFLFTFSAAFVASSLDQLVPFILRRIPERFFPPHCSPDFYHSIMKSHNFAPPSPL